MHVCIKAFKEELVWAIDKWFELIKLLYLRTFLVERNFIDCIHTDNPVKEYICNKINLHIFIHIVMYIHRCTCIVFTTYAHKYLRILYMLLNPSVASSIYLPYCYMINLCLNWLLSLYNYAAYAYVTELEKRWLPLMQQQGIHFTITW